MSLFVFDFQLIECIVKFYSLIYYDSYEKKYSDSISFIRLICKCQDIDSTSIYNSTVNYCKLLFGSSWVDLLIEKV